jgi:isoleucyl-tRNA synthetase
MTYASLNGFDPRDGRIPAEADRPALDRWALSRLEATKVTVTEGLEGYEPLGAASAIERLIDDLSNWYVRRSRRRFWRTEAGAPVEDSLSAQATLHTVLSELALIMAPFTPFLADATFRELTGRDGSDSVHLADWPASVPNRIAPDLEAQMAVTRRLTSLGRSSRADAGVKVRQPLARALVFLAPGSATPLLDVVADELNVDEVELASDLAAVLRYEIVPNFKTLGPRLGDRVQLLRAAFGSLDGAAVAATLERGETFVVDLDGGEVTIGPGDVELRMKSEGAFAVTRDGAEVVALDLTLTDALRRRGLARDLIRQLQDLRKASGLEVSDRISVRLIGAEEVAEHFDLIASEVLAPSILTEAGTGDPTIVDLDGQAVEAWIEKL